MCQLSARAAATERVAQALIVNNNQIGKLKGLNGLSMLNTLGAAAAHSLSPQIPEFASAVVSHNNIENIDCVKDLKNLTKISAAHNQIRSLDCLQVSGLTACCVCAPAACFARASLSVVVVVGPSLPDRAQAEQQ